jgi:type I restriction enzyme S subunit
LRTPFGKESLLARATGALHPHLEGGIRDIPVVVPPQAVQDELVADAGRAKAVATDTEETLRQQIELLHQRRRSVITAAVSGEIEVP